MKKITLFLIALIATVQTNATHILGGQITARCLGGFTKEITLTLYADVQGIPVPNSVTLDYVSNNFSWSTTKNVTHGAPYYINPTTMAYDFVDSITFMYLDYHTISYTTCCRSATIANISSVLTPLYIESVILNDTNCNSTPIIPVIPFPYAVVNTQSTYALNVYDLDGDSLTYQLVTPLESVGTQVGGYINPPVSISSTGVLNVYSTVMGVYDICIKVTEYRNGVEIGYVLREMQIVVEMSNGIDEVENNKFINYNECDILGRKINNNYNGIKLRYK